MSPEPEKRAEWDVEEEKPGWKRQKFYVSRDNQDAFQNHAERHA